MEYCTLSLWIMADNSSIKNWISFIQVSELSMLLVLSNTPKAIDKQKPLRNSF